MTNKITELFGHAANLDSPLDWAKIVAEQRCPYLGRKCLKNRKSQPEIAIGTCNVRYGRPDESVIICPFRLLERRQVFTDCLHLLTLHEPGNELHIVGEIAIPGGSVDYFIVSAKDTKVMDFVGIEFQTLDTTGTVWPERQRFLAMAGLPVPSEDVHNPKTFGMNWKVTAKTILVQLHHKIQTFEHINKHLALVIQDRLLDYMRREFSFDHLSPARLGDPMHVHSYGLDPHGVDLRLSLRERFSTDTAGIATCLGLQGSAKVELIQIMSILQSKISEKTLFSVIG